MRTFLFDLGAYNGDTIEAFYANRGNLYERRDNTNGYYIYAFEPNAHFWRLKDKFSNNPKIKVIPAAAWIKDGFIEFKNAPDSLSSCVSEYPMQCYDEAYSKREVMKSCNFVEFFRNIVFPGDYTIVKIDIESSEYTLIPAMLEAGLFTSINELYVEFHHTIEGWAEIKNTLCQRIIAQCPTIRFNPNWQ